MRKLTYLLLLWSIVCFQASAQDNSAAGVPASTNIRGAKDPLILPNHHVVFRIKAPDAQKVQIDLGKKYDLVKDAEGYWNVTTDSVGEGFHYYTLLIDGVAVADPASESFYGMGRMASGIEIPFAGGDYYSEKDVPHGDIRIKKYFSNVTKRGARCIFIPLRVTMPIQVKNTRCFTYCMAEAKTNAAGPPRAKRI